MSDKSPAEQQFDEYLKNLDGRIKEDRKDKAKCRLECIATAAMQGMLAHPNVKPRDDYMNNWRYEVAKESVRLARALIAELDK